MQTKGLATIVRVGTLIALLVTLGSVQSAFVRGSSGPKLTTHVGPPSTGDGVSSGPAKVSINPGFGQGKGPVGPDKLHQRLEDKPTDLIGHWK